MLRQSINIFFDETGQYNIFYFNIRVQKCQITHFVSCLVCVISFKKCLYGYDKMIFIAGIGKKCFAVVLMEMNKLKMMRRKQHEKMYFVCDFGAVCGLGSRISILRSLYVRRRKV